MTKKGAISFPDSDGQKINRDFVDPLLLDETSIEEERAAFFEVCVGSLPERCQKVIHLFLGNEEQMPLEIPQIAGKLKIKERRVKDLMEESLKRLRDQLSSNPLFKGYNDAEKAA